jgi:hypothetical protein
MAMFIFAEAILEGKPIKLFNHGNMRGISLMSMMSSVQVLEVRALARPAKLFPAILQ